MTEVPEASTSKPVISHPQPAPSNKFSSLIASQKIATVDSFTLESGIELQDVQVAYKTWGKLNAKRDNCMVICHALTGSADVEDWQVDDNRPSSLSNPLLGLLGGGL
jgi:homoserine O-acetyltransferase